jgi:hypothetical protein
MPNMTTLTINDRQPTPVPHDFKPQGIQNGVATFIHSQGIPAGDVRLTMSQTRNQNGRRKVTMKITAPVVGDVVVDGVTKTGVQRTNYAELTFNYDETSTQTERETVMAFVAYLTGSGNAFMNAIVRDLEGFW